MDNEKLVKAAPELLSTIQVIRIYCLTPEASHQDELYLKKLRQDFAPIIEECEKAIALCE